MTPDNESRTEDQRMLDSLGWLMEEVIDSIEWHHARQGQPLFTHCHAAVRSRPVGPGVPPRVLAGGTATNSNLALKKAISEAVERYCATRYLPDTVRVSSLAELGEEAIPPERFVLFHPMQRAHPRFPFTSPRPEGRYGWVKAFSLTANREVWVPATMALLYYEPLTTDDMFDRCPVSGYACGMTWEAAVFRGLCEVVERDAFTIAWYARRSLPPVDAAVLRSAEVAKTLARFHPVAGDITCLELSTDVGLPVVLAVQHGQFPTPATIVSAACDYDMEKAVVRALAELAANHLMMTSLLAAGRRVPATPAEVCAMEDHGLFYVPIARRPLLAHFIGGRRETRRDVSASLPAEPTARLMSAVERLRQRNLEVIAVDLTLPTVAALGFRVVKVLVPGMQPIDFGRDWQHLGGRRLYEVPTILGDAHPPRFPWEINRAPHPFP